jgi:methyl-accepting chemotaxis protein
MPKLDPQILLLAFIAIAGLAVLLQTIILLAIFLAVRKAAHHLTTQAEEMRSAVMPIVYNTREFIARIAPKVEDAVDDMARVAEGVRIQTADVQNSIADLLERFHQQAARLDEMTSQLLNSVERASSYVADTVSKPVRQASAVIGAVKAVVDSIRRSSGANRSL